MINVTNSAVVEKIKGTGRTFTLSIKVGTNTFTKVKSLRRSSIFASNQKLSVGESVSAFIEAEINDCRESLQNYEVEPILSIDEYDIPLGIFKVQAPSQADGSGTQKITAYDRMSETSKFTYKATGLTSAQSTFSAICSICGYTAVTSGLTDVTIDDGLLDGMDCRKALGYVAGVFGKNCVVGTDGKFKMVGYSTVSESVCKISIDSLDTLDFPSKVSTIDYFNAVVNEANIYKSGTGNNGVNIVNPLFKDTSQTYSILTQLQSTVGSNGYYPAKFKQLNGDPRIEVGDVIKVEHRDTLTGEVTSDYVPVMSLVMDYDGGVTVSIEAYPTESEFSMSLSDKMSITNSSNNEKFDQLYKGVDYVDGKVNNLAGDVSDASQKADFATIQAAAVEELNKVIGSSLGLYQTTIQGVGGDTKYYFHNKSTLEQSTYIISMTDQGFAFANSWNNENPVWTYGINPAGNSIMNYLIVNKISADLIEAGKLSSIDGANMKTVLNLETGELIFTSSDTTVRLQGVPDKEEGLSDAAYNELNKLPNRMAGMLMVETDTDSATIYSPSLISMFSRSYLEELKTFVTAYFKWILDPSNNTKPTMPGNGENTQITRGQISTSNIKCDNFEFLNSDGTYVFLIDMFDSIQQELSKLVEIETALADLQKKYDRLLEYLDIPAVPEPEKIAITFRSEYGWTEIYVNDEPLNLSGTYEFNVGDTVTIRGESWSTWAGWFAGAYEGQLLSTDNPWTFVVDESTPTVIVVK